jgi:hypothetical protein
MASDAVNANAAARDSRPGAPGSAADAIDSGSAVLQNGQIRSVVIT